MGLGSFGDTALSGCGEIRKRSEGLSRADMADWGEVVSEPVAGERARLWERLRSRRVRKTGEEAFFMGTAGTWRVGWVPGSGVVLRLRMTVVSVTMVGRDGDSLRGLRWKPERRRSIVGAGPLKEVWCG